MVELPQVLIVSGGMLNQDDEASLPVRAIFRAFPGDKLCNVSREAHGRPWLTRSLVLPDEEARTTAATAIARDLGARACRPGLVFSVVRGADDLALLDAVLAALPPGVPVIQDRLDGDPRDIAEFGARILNRPYRRIEVWAAGAALAAAIERHSARPVTPVAPWCWDALPEPKRRLRSVDSSVRAVMLGSLPDPSILTAIRRLWHRCREVMPALPPVDWYVHPADVQATLEAGYEPGDEVAWRGSYLGDLLQDRLATADLAVVPVNLEAEAIGHRARWVLPTRLAELCGAGLPIVAIASLDTATSRLVDAGQCGITVTGPDETAIAARLLDVLCNREQRAGLGANARAFAEREMAPGPAQAHAMGRIASLAGTFTPPAHWSGPLPADRSRVGELLK